MRSCLTELIHSEERGPMEPWDWYSISENRWFPQSIHLAGFAILRALTLRRLWTAITWTGEDLRKYFWPFIY